MCGSLSMSFDRHAYKRLRVVCLSTHPFFKEVLFTLFIAVVMKLFRFYSICVGLHLAISALAIRIALRSPPPAIPTTLGSHLSKTPPPVLADSGPPNTLYGGWNHPWGYGTVGKKNPQQFRLMFDTGKLPKSRITEP